jgi:ATP-dependent DNA helicase RecG
MQTAGLPAPTWQERTESVVMTLLRPKLPGVAIGALTGALTGALKQQVIQLVHTTPGIQRKTIAANTNGAARTVDRCIAQCIAENKIERRGSKKTGGYWPLA